MDDRECFYKMNAAYYVKRRHQFKVTTKQYGWTLPTSDVRDCILFAQSAQLTGKPGELLSDEKGCVKPFFQNRLDA